EQLGDKAVDMRSDPRLDQRVADQLARVLELYLLWQLEGCRNSLRFSRRGSEIVVQRLGRIETRDWKREHHFIEVARPPLAARLERRNSLTGDLAIQERREIAS